MSDGAQVRVRLSANDRKAIKTQLLEGGTIQDWVADAIQNKLQQLVLSKEKPEYHEIDKRITDILIAIFQDANKIRQAVEVGLRELGENKKTKVNAAGGKSGSQTKNPGIPRAV